MMRSAAAALVLALATGCDGCMGGPAPDPDAGPVIPEEPISTESLCVALHRGFYRQLAVSGMGAGECAEPSSVPLDLSELDSGEATLRYSAMCVRGNAIYDGLEEALFGGRVRFSLAAIQACAAAGRAVIDGAPITDANAELRGDEIAAAFAASDCDQAAVGLIEAGGVCVQPWDCADRTLVCEPETPATPERRCRAPAAEGEACYGSIGLSLPLRTCAAGLACIDDTCAPRRAEGAPCTSDAHCAEDLRCGDGDTCLAPSPAGGPCRGSIHSDCQDELFCRYDGTCGPAHALDEPCASVSEVCQGCGVRCLELAGEVRCRPTPQVGEPCNGAFDCADGAWCDADFPDDGSCQALAGEGGDCSRSIFACADDLECIDGVCLVLPGLGGACAQTGERCQGTLHCVDGVCWAGRYRDPCYDNDDCEAGLSMVCRPAASTALECGPQLDVGDACTADEQCFAWLHCPDGSCTSLPGTGEPCTDSGRCSPGAFCDATGSCAAWYAPGDPCTEDRQCAPGICLSEQRVCTVPPVTCWGQLGLFETFLFFSAALPLRLRPRRR